VSTTIASVTELFGKDKAPETFKFVVVTLEIVVLPKLVTPVIFKLVPVAEVKLRVEIVAAPKLVIPDTFKLVEVTEVMTVPAKFVRPEIFKLVEVTEVPTAVVNVKAPPRLVRAETYKLVLEALAMVVFARTVLVVKVIAPLENCMSGVPVTAVAVM